jgi:hypothetical protein
MVAVQGIVNTPSHSTVNSSCNPCPCSWIDNIGGDAGPFLFAPFLRFFRGLVVKQPITLDHVKSQVLGNYRTAIGDTVEPLAPCSFSGCTMKANS